MGRKVPPVPVSAEDRGFIESLARSKTDEARLVQRARIVKLTCWGGLSVTGAARRLGIRPNTVSDWRRRFAEKGVSGIYDRPRSGKPPRYGAEFREQVLRKLETPPPPGHACWDGPAVARALGASPHAVWRVLRKQGVCLARHRSWCVSTDPEFVPKAADIVGLYMNPPANALVICVDEKPSIQALERATGYVQTDNGKIVRGFRSTYRRHGTLNLFAALTVATGAVHAKTTNLKRRVEFIEFMDELMRDLPSAEQIHVILDNYCIHKRNSTWLEKHPTVTFHFTPTSASWLNMVEIWFGILSRKALRGASHKNTEELRASIEAFIAAYGPRAKPFTWRKREVKGSQLHNTIVNLCT